MRLIRKNYRDRRTYMLAAVDISSRRENQQQAILGIYLVLYKEEQVVAVTSKTMSSKLKL